MALSHMSGEIVPSTIVFRTILDWAVQLYRVPVGILVMTDQIFVEPKSMVARLAITILYGTSDRATGFGYVTFPVLSAHH